MCVFVFCRKDILGAYVFLCRGKATLGKCVFVVLKGNYTWKMCVSVGSVAYLGKMRVFCCCGEATFGKCVCFCIS